MTAALCTRAHLGAHLRGWPDDTFATPGARATQTGWWAGAPDELTEAATGRSRSPLRRDLPTHLISPSGATSARCQLSSCFEPFRRARRAGCRVSLPGRGGGGWGARGRTL